MAKDAAAKAADTEEDERSFGEKVKQELREWGATLAVVIPFFLFFTGLVYEQRVIPSESMVPTLQVSDRVAVAKFAYGYDRYSMPLNLGRFIPLPEGRIFAKAPKRGDIAVFEHTHTARVMIKRVIGLPGDTIQMIDETLYLNGDPVDAELVRSVQYVPHGDSNVVTAHEWRETIDGKSWISHRQLSGTPGDDTVVFKVPEGHVFLMGDNRDNSLDSRFLSGHCPPEDGVVSKAGCPLSVPADRASVGFVPMDHLIGRADTVLLTLHKCKLRDGETCPKRAWKGL